AGEVGDAGVADQQVDVPELERQLHGGAAIIGMKRAEPRPAQRGEDLADDHGVLVGHDDVQAILLAWRPVGLHCSPWTREASREWQVSTAWKIAGCTCLWVRTAPPPGGKAAAAVAAMCHRRGAEGAEGSEPGVDRSSSGSDRDAGFCGCEGSGNRSISGARTKGLSPDPRLRSPEVAAPAAPSAPLQFTISSIRNPNASKGPACPTHRPPPPAFTSSGRDGSGSSLRRCRSEDIVFLGPGVTPRERQADRQPKVGPGYPSLPAA